MITCVQRASRIKLRPSGQCQRMLVAYLIAPAYLDLNRSKSQRKMSWWSRFINFLAHFPLRPPPWLKMRLFWSLVLGVKFGASSVPFNEFCLTMPIGGAHGHASQLGTDPMGWI